MWNEKTLRFLLDMMVRSQELAYLERSEGLTVEQRCRLASGILMWGGGYVDIG